jgi:NAD(P)-dependent dehydrogenase (short-subunit alcohol dehydrogenase family)
MASLPLSRSSRSHYQVTANPPFEIMYSLQIAWARKFLAEVGGRPKEWMTMLKSLEGRVALVTGVSHAGQVGQTVAKALAAEGAALAICARTQSNVDVRAAELRQSGARVLSLAVSLTDEVQVRRLIADVVNEFKRIDILVNLAGGLTRYKPAIENELEDWRAEVDNNLLSAFLASRDVFTHMAKAGGGSIINFSRAGSPQANMVAYNCAKAGVEALTRTLALEGRDIGIRVNAIAPGLVDTESNVAALKPKDLEHWVKRDDIASAAVFLASPATASVTGQVLPVTGWGFELPC